MDVIIQKLIDALVTGGGGAVVAVLVLMVVGLVYDRFQIKAELEKREERIDKLIDDFYDNAIKLNGSLSGLREVMVEIKGRMSRHE